MVPCKLKVQAQRQEHLYSMIKDYQSCTFMLIGAVFPILFRSLAGLFLSPKAVPMAMESSWSHQSATHDV